MHLPLKQSHTARRRSSALLSWSGHKTSKTQTPYQGACLISMLVGTLKTLVRPPFGQPPNSAVWFGTSLSNHRAFNACPERTICRAIPLPQSTTYNAPPATIMLAGAARDTFGLGPPAVPSRTILVALFVAARETPHDADNRVLPSIPAIDVCSLPMLHRRLD